MGKSSVSKAEKLAAELAIKAGLAKDQILNFRRAEYVPLPKLLGFHASCRECDRLDGPDRILLAGTRGAAKTHTAFAQVALDDCQRYAGLKWLFLRKVQKSAGESLDDLVAKILHSIPHTYTRGDGRVVFPNGSRILIGGYNIPSDIDKYLGIEYDGIVIEECTQLTDDKQQKIGMSLRTTKPGWRERMYMTTNADGVGVQWCKRDFVLPWRQGKLTTGRYFEAYYDDNPYLTDSYRRRIGQLRGSLHRAWAKLDWDAFEGMAFPMWSYDTHVVNPVEIPSNWLRWRAVDWGSAAPFCCLWFAKDPQSSRIIVYRELYETGLTDDQQARRIVDMTMPDERISHTLADPASYWQKKSGKEGVFVTAEQTYRDYGVPLTKADNERINGKRRVDQALSNLADGRPGLVVYSTCTNLIDQLSNLIYDDIRIEDIDTTMEDHAYDALRYGLSNYRPPATEVVKPAAQTYDMGGLKRIL